MAKVVEVIGGEMKYGEGKGDDEEKKRWVSVRCPSVRCTFSPGRKNRGEELGEVNKG